MKRKWWEIICIAAIVWHWRKYETKTGQLGDLGFRGMDHPSYLLM